MNVQSSKRTLSSGQTVAAQRLTRRLDYRFHDQALFGLALTHRSIGRLNNERLEFFGDALLGCIIAEHLYQRFPEAGEGALSRLRARLVKGQTLAEIARELKLCEALVLGSGELRSGGANRDSILAGAMEAIIAAIHIDSDGQATRDYVLSIFSRRLKTLTIEQALKDPKTRLQEWLQARALPLPIYQLLDESKLPGGSRFRVSCCLDGLLTEAVFGDGGSRRQAEQAAAEQVLAVITEDNNPGKKR